MLKTELHIGDLEHPIETLEGYFRTGGTTIIQAAFAHSYFTHPDAVLEKPVYYPDRARRSREHYPGLEAGGRTIWSGNGQEREVVLDYNQRAQMAWGRYTGHALARRTGYSVRHIWGHPWDPDAYTAGWNLCYMPFWAGMLTEEQHPHEELERAIRQASWELYFRDNPVCQPPEFVENPGLDLCSLLDGQPILILHRATTVPTLQSRSAATEGSVLDMVKEIRTRTRISWTSIRKAARKLQGLDHDPFGSPNVENKGVYCVRRINKETGLTFAEIENLSAAQGR